MTTRYFGQPIKRNEDPRLLTGQALFTDDVHLPNLLHVAFLRSVYAHARIRSIDVSAALDIPGVVAIYTADDLGDYWKPGPLLVPPPPVKDLVFNQRTQVPLPKTKYVTLANRLWQLWPKAVTSPRMPPNKFLSIASHWM